MKKKFLDIKEGDIVIACDEASHDYTQWTIKVTTIEYDEDFVTETNPKGMHCYGECLDKYGEFDDYITHVNESNFICIEGTNSKSGDK